MNTRSTRFFVSTLASLMFLATTACSSAPSAPPPAHPLVAAAPAPVQAPPKVEQKSDDETMTCTLGKENRQIEIRSKDKGCEVLYTKAGNTSAVASDKVGMDHCQKTLAKMRGKLEAGGYACK